MNFNVYFSLIYKQDISYLAVLTAHAKDCFEYEHISEVLVKTLSNLKKKMLMFFRHEFVSYLSIFKLLNHSEKEGSSVGLSMNECKKMDE